MPRPIRVIACLPIYKPYVPDLFEQHKDSGNPLPKGLAHPKMREAFVETAKYWRGEIQIALCVSAGDACLDRARGGLFAKYQYLRDTQWGGVADFLWMLDGDVSWRPEDLGRLIQRDLPLVGAAYCIKTDEAEAAGQQAGRYRDGVMPDDTGLIETEYLNGGFMLIQDATLRAMVGQYPELRYTINPPELPLPSCALWQPMVVPYSSGIEGLTPDDQEYLSEDYAFCYRARAAGFPPYQDLGVLLGHWDGEREYRLKTAQREL